MKHRVLSRYLPVLPFILTGLTALMPVTAPAAGTDNTHLSACFVAAGKRYAIDPALLQAIARRESGMRPDSISHNRNRRGQILSTDYGIMQINSSHIPDLVRLGVIRDKSELLTRACLNIHTGAWILARHFQKCGVTWECLGSYNAGFAPDNTARRMHYARLIYRDYMQRRGYGGTP